MTNEEKVAPVEEPVAPESVPPTPAAKAAGKARTHLIDAAQLSRPDRRPAPATREVALPLLSACGYLADAVMDLQGQVARLERLLDRDVSATLGLAEFVEGEHEVVGALRDLAQS